MSIKEKVSGEKKPANKNINKKFFTVEKKNMSNQMHFLPPGSYFVHSGELAKGGDVFAFVSCVCKDKTYIAHMAGRKVTNTILAPGHYVTIT